HAIVNDLAIDLAGRTEDAQPRLAIGMHPQRPPDASQPAGGRALIFRHALNPRFRLFYFFFPSLRKMNSSEYLIPLPLYGSGGRKARISAAVCPTFRLSMPVITTSVGFGVAIAIPKGI